MRTICILTILAVAAGSGCTTVSLSQYTLDQNRSSGSCRDEMVLECLATIAANPDTLPSYALYSAGATTVTDTVALGHTVTWAPAKRVLETLALTGSRSPKGQWTVDPSVEYERLEALYTACLWALYGPSYFQGQKPSILGNQKDYLDQKPHFAVQERLDKMPHGWLQHGSKKEVPECARYKAHKGNTWVWVMPNDSESFSQFILALLDIATLDLNGGYGFPLLVTLTTYEITKQPDSVDPTKALTIATTEYRMVKKEYRDIVSKAIQDGLTSGKAVALTRTQWLAYTDQWFGLRSAPTGPVTSLAARTSATQLTLPGAGGVGISAGPSIPGRPVSPSTFQLR